MYIECVIVIGPNFKKSLEPQPRYGDLYIFQDGGHRHLGFSKCQFFNGQNDQGVELHDYAKFCRNRFNRG